MEQLWRSIKRLTNDRYWHPAAVRGDATRRRQMMVKQTVGGGCAGCLLCANGSHVNLFALVAAGASHRSACLCSKRCVRARLGQGSGGPAWWCSSVTEGDHHAEPLVRLLAVSRAGFDRRMSADRWPALNCRAQRTSCHSLWCPSRSAACQRLLSSSCTPQPT